MTPVCIVLRSCLDSRPGLGRVLGLLLVLLGQRRHRPEQLHIAVHLVHDLGDLLAASLDAEAGQLLDLLDQLTISNPIFKP